MKLGNIIFLFAYAFSAHCQGTFQNLNFESANVSGYAPNSSDAPISAALPGWNGFYGSNPTSQVWYDGISTGGNIISVVDNKDGSLPPIQGNYSAFLFGGAGLSASISQTAKIPAGTQTLTMEAYEYDGSPTVAINGQAINMIPEQNISFYTVYSGSIPSADVGPSITLSFTAPPGGPSFFELDDISFSQIAITPEPGTFALTAIAAIAGLIFFTRKWLAR